MVRQKSGAIVNVSSIWGRLGGSYEVDYSTSKGALITFTKALAKELGPSGVRVNSVTPGMIDTDMNASLSDEDKRAFLDNTALGRIGNSNEVAKVIEFLSNDDSSYVTGVDIAVDGLIL
jgi:3-oxoacyl-[acyl-carrier protein] reductase